MAGWAELAVTQPRVTGVLTAALATGRMHHAYLLVGPEPTAAELVFAALAGALVCEAPRGAEACGACSGCRRLEVGSHPDVVIVAPNEKGLITIDQVREAAARLSLKASASRTKVVHVARADAMNPAAQNALLKTLEEPPGPTCFVLTATRLRALLPTVRSRCLTLRLAPDDRRQAAAKLAAGGVEPSLARLLGPLIGADVARAGELVEQGAAEVATAIAGAGGALDAQGLVGLAADLGSSRDRADLALAMLEVMLRDALARRHGAHPEMLYGVQVGESLAQASGAALASTVSRLQQLRRLVNLHLNRTLALEGVFMSLAGKSGAAP